MPQTSPRQVVEKLLKGFHCTEDDIRRTSPCRPLEDSRLDSSVAVNTLYGPGECVKTVTSYDVQRAGQIGLFRQHRQIDYSQVCR